MLDTHSSRTLKGMGLCLLLILSVLSSCSSPSPEVHSAPSSYSSAEQSEGSKRPHVHEPEPVPAVAPTCQKTGLTESMRCKICGAYTTPPKTIPRSAHTCEDGFCEVCDQLIRSGDPVPEDGIWHGGYYLDEFGDATDVSVVFTDTIKGTFSNSATSKSNLSVIIDAEQDCMKIKLFEYDKYRVTVAIYSYDIHIKYGDTKEVLYADLSDGSVLIQNRDFTKLKNILLNGDDIQFVIKEDGGTSTYNFTVSASNFCYMYSLTFPLYGISSIAKIAQRMYLSDFRETLANYPEIKDLDASAIFEIYKSVFIKKFYRSLDRSCDLRDITEDEMREFYKQTADEFDIYPNQAAAAYTFTEDNYDLVESAAEYEKSN